MYTIRGLACQWCDSGYYLLWSLRLSIAAKSCAIQRERAENVIYRNRCLVAAAIGVRSMPCGLVLSSQICNRFMRRSAPQALPRFDED